jgi:NAD(P)H-dependent nitrite reductase large subunit
MSAKRRLIVVGNGMAGARLVEEMLSRGGGDQFEIIVFGDEPHGNYNRILLSGVLAGTHRSADVMLNSPEWYRTNAITLCAGSRVERINLKDQTVASAGGRVEHYDVLVLATGSRPLVPPIDGLRRDDGRLRDGAFVFRTLDDCDRIAAVAKRARSAAVIGGGLLGLEAARGLLNFLPTVHVVHLTGHVMDAQLDRQSGQILRRQLESMGLVVWLNKSTTHVIDDDERIAGLRFSDATSLSCEMVVVAAGIRPNIELAREAGLTVAKGIVVGDDLACAGAENVFAVGECVEHRGQIYGLLAPAWEQTRVLADRLTGRNAGAKYDGSRPSTKLKVAGVDLAVMGLKEPSDDDEVITYAEPARGIYKKLIVRDNRLVGATVMGDGTVVPTLTQMFMESSPLPGNRSEALFSVPVDLRLPAPQVIPDSAQICDCNGVSKARIIEAVLSGARSVQAVCDVTRASTGCGTCRPEVERIVALACQGIASPRLLEAPAFTAVPPAPSAGPGEVVVTLNKIERYKKEKDGLDVLADVPSLAQSGWQRIDEGDRERLKWAGVFFRRQTPGQFMMRVRISNGLTNADQLNVLADVSEEFGTGRLDITTRQQIQVRGFGIEHVPEIWRRLEAAGLVSLQTGMDNVRNVIGCAAAGLTSHELFDASPIVHEFTALFLKNKMFSNLPRKFNVGITGCTEHCTHSETQDLALTPAVRDIDGEEVPGFNVAVGGKMGSGGCRIASPLNIFIELERAAALCAEIVLLFRDHGGRSARNRARLAFLVDAWGTERFKREIQQRVNWTLMSAGRDARTPRGTDHLGVNPQKQRGLSYIGLAVPVGRISATEVRHVARIAGAYGNGEVRLTTGQNIIIPNIADDRLLAVLEEPLLAELKPDPPASIRGLVACTGIDYCHFSLIETKEQALRTARYLSDKLPHNRRIATHWSGCPAGCGNHAMADVGLLGKNIRVNGEVVEAVDVYIGGSGGPKPRAGVKVLEDVPCDDLPVVLERLIPFITNKRMASSRDVERAASPESETSAPEHVHT